MYRLFLSIIDGIINTNNKNDDGWISSWFLLLMIGTIIITCCSMIVFVYRNYFLPWYIEHRQEQLLQEHLRRYPYASLIVTNTNNNNTPKQQYQYSSVDDYVYYFTPKKILSTPFFLRKRKPRTKLQQERQEQQQQQQSVTTTITPKNTRNKKKNNSVIQMNTSNTNDKENEKTIIILSKESIVSFVWSWIGSCFQQLVYPILLQCIRLIKDVFLHSIQPFVKQVVYMQYIQPQITNIVSYLRNNNWISSDPKNNSNNNNNNKMSIVTENTGSTTTTTTSTAMTTWFSPFAKKNPISHNINNNKNATPPPTTTTEMILHESIIAYPSSASNKTMPRSVLKTKKRDSFGESSTVGEELGSSSHRSESKRSVIFSEHSNGQIKTEKYYYLPHQTPDHRYQGGGTATTANNSNNNRDDDDVIDSPDKYKQITSQRQPTPQSTIRRQRVVATYNSNKENIGTERNTLQQQQKQKAETSSSHLVPYAYSSSHSPGRRELVQSLTPLGKRRRSLDTCNNNTDHEKVDGNDKNNNTNTSKRFKLNVNNNFSTTGRVPLYRASRVSLSNTTAITRPTLFLSRRRKSILLDKRLRQEMDERIWNDFNNVSNNNNRNVTNNDNNKRLKTNQEGVDEPSNVETTTIAATVAISNILPVAATGIELKPRFEFGSTPDKTPPPGTVVTTTTTDPASVGTGISAPFQFGSATTTTTQTTNNETLPFQFGTSSTTVSTNNETTTTNFHFGAPTSEKNAGGSFQFGANNNDDITGKSQASVSQFSASAPTPNDVPAPGGFALQPQSGGSSVPNVQFGSSTTTDTSSSITFGSSSFASTTAFDNNNSNNNNLSNNQHQSIISADANNLSQASSVGDFSSAGSSRNGAPNSDGFQFGSSSSSVSTQVTSNVSGAPYSGFGPPADKTIPGFGNNTPANKSTQGGFSHSGVSNPTFGAEAQREGTSTISDPTSTTPSAMFGGNAAPAFTASSNNISATPGFGGTGTPSTSFGGAAAPDESRTSTPTISNTAFAPSAMFGGNTAPAFSASSSIAATPGFGGLRTPAPGFGGAITPAFGAPGTDAPRADTPTMSNSSSGPSTLFGGNTAPAFGVSSSIARAPAFGGAGAPSTSFGGATSQAFGAQGTQGFSMPNSASASSFGAKSTTGPAFGGSATFDGSSTPASTSFGASSNNTPAASTFGQFNKSSSAPMFGAPNPSTSTFGASNSVMQFPPPPPFGTSMNTATGTPNFASSTASNPPMFGAQPPPTFGQQQPAGGFNVGTQSTTTRRPLRTKPRGRR